MRKKVRRDSTQQVLLRILDAFAQELTDVADEEIFAAAGDLGMDLGMKWSAAFAGLIYPTSHQALDFFDAAALKRLPQSPNPAARRRLPSTKKPPEGK